MSENAVPKPRKPDARAARTRDRLGDALIDLLVTKPFDDITVQEVLTRAGVSRSTFYEHYRDKSDLLISDVDEFFAMFSNLLSKKGDTSPRLAPVEEFFTHVGESGDLVHALMESGRLHEVRDLGEAHFARGIAARLPSHAAANPARAHGLAGMLFSLLFWWLRQGRKQSPAEMDRLFHRFAA